MTSHPSLPAFARVQQPPRHAAHSRVLPARHPHTPGGQSRPPRPRHARDREEYTALLISVRAGAVECVQALLEAGSDVQVANVHGDTLSSFAARLRSDQRRRILELVDSARRSGAFGSRAGGPRTTTPPVALLSYSEPSLDDGEE